MKRKSIFPWIIFSSLLGMNYQNLQNLGINSELVLANGLKSEVINFEGRATIQKAGMSNQSKIEIGTQLAPRDRIIIESGEVTVLCGNGALWYVNETSTVAEGCLITNSNSNGNSNLEQPQFTNTY